MRAARITVNEYFQTTVPHIYAAGDVIGFPAAGGDVNGAGAARDLRTRSACR